MTGDEFETSMCHAARHRRTVELIDGRVGVLVYWPGRGAASRARTKPLRHGDPLMAGVRFDPARPDTVSQVVPHDIIGFAP